MFQIFNPDNKFNIIMSRVGDLLILNLLFILTSLPIFTIGAAGTALSTVCFRFGTDREEGTVKSYLKAFRENFRKSTIAWLILAAFLGLSAFSFLFFSKVTGPLHYLQLIPALGLGLGILVLCCIFPLMSQFENSLGQSFKNALILSVAYLPRILLTAVILLLPFALFLVDLYIFMRIGFLFLLLHFSFTAFAGSRLMKRPFEKLLEASQAAEN